MRKLVRTLITVAGLLPLLIWLWQRINSVATWTAPVTWTTGQLVSHTDLNEQIRDNMDYLLNPDFGSVTLDTTDKTQTATVMTDITGASFAFDSAGEDVWIVFNVMVSTSNSGGNIAQGVTFDITIDGARQSSDDGIIGVYYPGSGTLTAVPCVVMCRKTALAAGAHTAQLQAKCYAASGTTTATFFCGAGTAGRDVHLSGFSCKA